MKIWKIEDFNNYCIEKIKKYYYISASEIVLSSFYIAEVLKHGYITVSQFNWLKSIAEQQINNYKSKLWQEDNQ